MESFFVDIGLSWTFSKVLPFILCALLGVVLFLFIRRKSILLKWLGVSLIVLLPGIYFAFNPIYEGDFTNEYEVIRTSDVAVDFEDGNLTVLAIPNCPFCYESLQDLGVIHSRTKSKEFNFLVLTSDIGHLEFYKEIGKGVVKIDNATEFEEYSKLSKGRYPAFVYRNGDELMVWSNRGFGVVALDWLEEKISN